MSDAWDDVLRRYGLTFAEGVRIRDEVGAGQVFAEPHLRGAAVEWAQHRLETEGIAQLWATRWRRAVLVVALLIFVGAMVWKLNALETGRSTAALWVGPALLALNVLAWWNRRRLLRATISGNEDQPGSPRP